MSVPLIKRPQARLDLLETYYYLACDSENAAERYLESAERTFQQIATMPMLGATRQFGHRALQGLRSRSIDDFPNWLIFYLVREDAVEIIRVLHGARDLDRIFDDEPV